MKKNKLRKRIGVKTSKSNRSKFHRSYKKVETLITEPGPSKVITYDENGKVVSFNSRGKTKHEDTLTKVGKEAMAANKKAKSDKKEAVKRILNSVGFDPTVKYSKKERKHFARIVKNNLFVKAKPVNLTDEEIKTRINARKEKRIELLKERPLASEIAKKVKQATLDLKNLLKSKSSKSITTAEEKQQFTRSVQLFSKDNPMKSYDFYTDTIEAVNEDEALKLSKEFAKKYSNNPEFAGMSITPKGTTNKHYFPKATLLAA